MDTNLDSPLISILLPIYGESVYFEESLYSILVQSYKNFELLIIYDGDYSKMYEKYVLIDNRIIFIDGKKKGISAALNLGVLHAKGEYIARMDVDDMSSVDRIEEQLKYLIKNDLDICGSNLKLFPDSLHIRKRGLTSWPRSDRPDEDDHLRPDHGGGP